MKEEQCYYSSEDAPWVPTDLEGLLAVVQFESNMTGESVLAILERGAQEARRASAHRMRRYMIDRVNNLHKLIGS